ncbi:kinase-like domain-containing protein [Pyrenochaeta sp. MPI-SDFR-AT-0127]|nr:kinase-like domain-containing protein [Pyrenochaeta sp. MPI-SDFR-AT-0127]
MSLTGSSSTWSTFLSDLPASDDIGTIPGEDQFHRNFVEYCTTIRERDPQRLLARFLRHHDQIIAFIGALDESTGLDTSRCLSSVFWSKAFETVQRALDTRQRDKLFRQCLPRLSDVIPAFGPELSLFPDNEVVQKPLQTIFAVYMECYERMFQVLDLQYTDVNFEAFIAQVEGGTQTIATLKDEWEQLIKQAAIDQAAARHNNTNLSYYNTTVGPYNPYRTNVSFEWQETLGQGAYGQVHKVRETSTGTFYAQKVIRVTDPNSKAHVEKEVLNEVAIMQKLRHHHIASVQFHVFEGDTYSLIMLPVAECDLRAFLRRCADKQFPRTELTHITSWFGCLVSALAYAHSKHIKHEDIKPSNILIKDHQPYLTDFGCAKDFSELDSSTSTDTLTFGTPVYWAPESQPRGRSADVFSLGCVFSEMLTVRHKRRLEDFQKYRYVKHRDNAYAFRENLDKVLDWLDDIIPRNDEVGDLLKEQTFKMLERSVHRRREAKDIKRSLRTESDYVFCTTCS